MKSKKLEKRQTGLDAYSEPMCHRVNKTWQHKSKEHRARVWDVSTLREESFSTEQKEIKDVARSSCSAT